ncbi:MAG: glycosyltransferase family 2 protein [Terriglobia bacterium]
MTTLSYVLVTPARNEAAFIEQTIQSVAAQTARPARWVIVSDGSTDRTDEIVNHYVVRHDWIKLLRMPERRERHFAGKVYAFNAGYAEMAGTDFDVVGSLDADITFEPDHFEFLLRKFAENSRLGVAGTPFVEGTREYDYRFTSIEHVSGACQLFRRECFEEIGGYTPIKTGGIDLVAVITARMKGWQTRSFPEKACIHHRKEGAASRGTVASAFHGGYTDYTHGCDPLWEFPRCLYQMARPPILVIGGLFLAGYLWAMITRADRVVTPEFIRFRKTEQRRRLRQFLDSLLARKPLPVEHETLRS